MVNVLVSACLAGVKCRYDGRDNFIKDIEIFKDKINFVPVCPELDGGLSCPREPSEIKNGRVITKNGKDVTEQFLKGAKKAIETAQQYGCKAALLKAKSPSCGNGKIYNGNFEGVLCDGDGVTAALLMKNGIKVFCETQIDALLQYLEQNKEV